MEALREIQGMNTFTITVPQGSQTALLRSMSRNLGWTIKATPRKRTTVTRPKAKKADPTCMTKEEYFAKIDRAKEQVRQGKVGPRFSSVKDLFEYIESTAE